MFVTISYVPRTSENRPLFPRIFKPSESDSNVCYGTLRSTYRWNWDFKLSKFMQVPSVSAGNCADLCFRAMSVYTPARL